jgi:hypothetical protein
MEQLEFRVPPVFLPPRFRDLSEGRDLLLTLDDDLTVHIRWHNEDFHTHHPLTIGATRRLVGEIMNYIKQYKEHLRVFGTFINKYGEQPFDEERYHDGFCQEKEATQRAKKDGQEEEEEHEAQGQEEEQDEVRPEFRRAMEARRAGKLFWESHFEQASEIGGESPCPDPDADY